MQKSRSNRRRRYISSRGAITESQSLTTAELRSASDPSFGGARKHVQTLKFRPVVRRMEGGKEGRWKNKRRSNDIIILHRNCRGQPQKETDGRQAGYAGWAHVLHALLPRLRGLAGIWLDGSLVFLQSDGISRPVN